MPSELQRIAQQLLATSDEIPRVVAYLHDRASKYRESAGWIGSISSSPSARMAAMQLDEAARRCEEAAHHLSMAPPKARSWVEQMVSGVRTTEPAGGSTSPRPDASDGSPPSAGRRHNEDQDEPDTKKPGKTTRADDRSSLEEEQATPRTSDEDAWRLFRKLPVRVEKFGRREKTRGIWRDEDGTEHDLVSGQHDEQLGDLYRQAEEFAIKQRLVLQP